MRTSHTQLGYSLIETLIAVSILMLAIVAPMTIAIKSIQSSQYALEQNTATFLAQEAISIVESVRNRDALDHRRAGGASSWDEIPSVFADCDDPGSGTFYGCNFDASDPIGIGSGDVVECVSDSDCNISFNTSLEPSAFNISDSGEDTGFVRRVYLEDITDASSNVIGVIVKVEVKWTSHFLGGDKGVVMVTSLYDRYKSPI